MKKITFISAMLLGVAMQAQNVPIDFETGGNGANWTWTVFENNINPALEIVANPDPTGENTSATVAKFTALQSGMPYAGCESQHGSDIGTFSLNANTSTITIKVWKTAISDVGIKLADAGGGSLGEIKVANTLVNQWETLSFNFSSMIGITYDQIIIFPDFIARPADRIIYFDDIMFGAQMETPQEPLAAAPNPTENAADVISMFSNVYTNVAVDTWKTDWSSATLEDILIQGNDTKKYTSLDFVGIEATGVNSIDASEMTTFHLDMWSPNVTTFRVKLVDFGADNAFGGGDDSEHEIVINSPSLGQWVSLAIPLADFAGLTSTSHISQIILSCLPTAQGTVYVDNVYFSTTPVVSDEPMTAAPTPTIPSSNVISMFSNAYTNVAVDTWRTVWSNATLDDIQIQGNDTKKYSALDFVGIETTGANAIDATEMTTFHLDMWSPNVTTFRVKLVDFGADNAFGGGDDSEHEIIFENPTLGEWVSLEIPLNDFVGLASRAHLSQLILSCLPTAQGTVYVDNVYFSNETFSNDAFEKASIALYPNPTQGMLQLSSSDEISNYEIYNITGQRILSGNVNASHFQINTANLQSGIYLLKTDVNGQISTQKFIKN